MKDTIYNASDLEPEKNSDTQLIYREVVTGIGNIKSGEDMYYVKRRFLKGYEVEVASYHILEGSDLELPGCRFIPRYGITFTDVQKDAINLDEYLRDVEKYQELDMELLKDSVATKILVGDHDIETRNFIMYPEDGRIAPVDFELSGGTDKDKRMELKARDIIRKTDADFSYGDVLEEAKEMYRKIDTDGAFERIESNGLYTPEVKEMREYMDGRFGS